jgi:hypothetical protein
VVEDLQLFGNCKQFHGYELRIDEYGGYHLLNGRLLQRHTKPKHRDALTLSIYNSCHEIKQLVVRRDAYRCYVHVYVFSNGVLGVIEATKGKRYPFNVQYFPFDERHIARGFIHTLKEYKRFLAFLRKGMLWIPHTTAKYPTPRSSLEISRG